LLPDSQLLFPRPTPEEVLADLTEFFYTDSLNIEAQRALEKRKGIVALLKKKGKRGDISYQDLADVLVSSDEALNALISLLGISQERFLGIFSLKRVSITASGKPMPMRAIIVNIKKDRKFAEMAGRFLLDGRSDPELISCVPPFELEKFDKRKLLLVSDALVDSLLRLGLKGRFDAKKGDILEDYIEEILHKVNVQYIRAETRLPGLSRDLDFIIPNVSEPYILIESGLFETTARELSDKARVENLGLEEIEQRYPQAHFVRVTDGIGWKRRGGKDLENLIRASHYFLVFKTLRRLEEIVRHYVPKQYFNA